MERSDVGPCAWSGGGGGAFGDRSSRGLGRPLRVLAGAVHWGGGLQSWVASLTSCSTGNSCEIESQNVCYEGDSFNMDKRTCESGVGWWWNRKYTFGADGDFSSWRGCSIRGYRQTVGKVTFTDVHGGANKTFIKYR